MKVALITLLAGALAVAPSRGADSTSQLGDLSEADTIAALSTLANEAAKADRFSGAILVARDGNILLQRGPGAVPIGKTGRRQLWRHDSVWARLTCPGIFGPFITWKRLPGWWNRSAA